MPYKSNVLDLLLPMNEKTPFSKRRNKNRNMGEAISNIIVLDYVQVEMLHLATCFSILFYVLVIKLYRA